MDDMREATTLGNRAGHLGATRKPVDRAVLVLVAVNLSALWALGWVPSLINLMSQGRYTLESGTDAETVTQTAAASSVSAFLSYASVAAALLLLVRTISNLGTVQVGAVGALLFLWGSIYALPVLLGRGQVEPYQLAFPLLILAFACAGVPAPFVTSIIAHLTVIAASFSIILGATTPYGLMSPDWHSAGDKAVIGSTILAGPYSHSNALALCLALGLPAVLMSYKGTRRVTFSSIVSFALLWSSSRTSLLVSIAVIASCIAVARLGSGASARKLVRVLSILAISALVLTPILTTDPVAFTNRGLIWQRSLERALDAPILGYGASTFSSWTEVTRSIGTKTTTGHNVFVTLAATGGGVALLLAAVALVALLRRAFASFELVPELSLLLFTLLLLGIVEDPLRALRSGPQAFAVWGILAAIAAVPLLKGMPAEQPPAPGQRDPIVRGNTSPARLGSGRSRDL